MINRLEINKAQPRTPNVDFSKIKVGPKQLEDAVINLGTFKKVDSRLGDKCTVLKAIYDNDYETMREISDFFFRTSGIYSRLCRYMAKLYRYDWLVTPYINDDKQKPEKVLTTFHQILGLLDNFGVKRFFGDVALKVIRYGCYYGYLVESNGKVAIQELPVAYCRSRFNVNGRPAIEFNMRFFDDYFRDTEQRMKYLKLFPAEFRKGYVLYKENKLPPEFPGDKGGWYLLDTEKAFKFNIDGEDYPLFIATIPAIIDLDAAQDLDRKKFAQQLLKIIIQKMPIDKNGELIFDVDEAMELHNNAVRMIGKAIGLDVLTTFADVDVADMAESSNTTSDDTMDRTRQNVYDQAGVSQMQFNTDGNIALEKSILNDEATLYDLILQFEGFLNFLIKPFNKSPKKMEFRVQILATTIYNYKEMSKLYKEQTQLGYSKMLPQIALGQSQSSILANAYFENDILQLYEVFIPPLMSSTMNGDFLINRENGGNSASKGPQGGGSAASKIMGDKGEAGRKELSDDQKSEKTIANKESMS
ncbi:MAG: hypothetical protein KBT06_04525 [Prevotellaceae bacterium]|nr:hypothetical protein [Candidatus Colivivens equi]